MEFYILLLCLLIAAAYVYSKVTADARLPPLVPNRIPYFGNLFQVMEDPIRFLNTCRAKYGQTFRFVLNGKIVTILGPEYNRNLGRTKEHLLSFSDAVTQTIKLNLTLGIESILNPVHADLIKSHFTPNLKLFTKRVFLEAIAACEDYFGTEANGQRVVSDLMEVAKLLVSRISSRCMTGEQVYNDPELLYSFRNFTHDVHCVTKAGKYLPDWLLRIVEREHIQKVEAHRRTFTRILLPVIKKRREQDGAGDEESKEEVDFLQYLINYRDEEGNPITDNECAQRIGTMIFASIITTANAIRDTIYHLVEWPVHVQKVIEEQQAVIEKHGHEVTAKSLLDMKYLDACIRESLRLDNSGIFGMSRIAREDVVLEAEKGGKEVLVKKGSFVTSCSYFTHFNSDLWSDPTVFDPTRFFKAVTASQFAPWGTGIHSCPGRFFAVHELKVALSFLFRHYQLSFEQGPPPRKMTINGLMRVDAPIRFTRKSLG